MVIREATLEDVQELHRIRMAVRENQLSHPGRITPADYERNLVSDGRGWLCEVDRAPVGFAIVNLVERNVWALFIQPGYEGQGIGRALQETMLEWYFGQCAEPIWLSTGAGTRAEGFYRHTGWVETGRMENGEIRFELNAESSPRYRP